MGQIWSKTRDHFNHENEEMEKRKASAHDWGADAESAFAYYPAYASVPNPFSARANARFR